MKTWMVFSRRQVSFFTAALCALVVHQNANAQQTQTRWLGPSQPADSQNSLSLSPTVSSAAAQNSSNDNRTEALNRSEYFYLPAGGHSLAEVSFSEASETAIATDSSGASTPEKSSAEIYSFQYRYGFSDSLALSVDTSFSKSRATISDATTLASGLNDFSLGLVKHNHHGSWTFLYGAMAEISPEQGRAASSQAVGSNFSGAQALMPFVGFDTTLSGGSVLGSKFSLSTRIGGNGPSEIAGSNITYSSSPTTANLTGFYEFPVIRAATFGVAVSLLATDSFYFNDGDRTYVGQAYTTVRVLGPDSALKFAVESISAEGGSQGVSSTQFSAAFRKTL